MFYKVQIALVFLICALISRNAASHGKWKQHYDIQFPFVVNGKHYFYAQSIPKDGYNYFIQELKPGGKMGDQTDGGVWRNIYESTFPFYYTSEKLYFFGQSKRNRYYFTQELLPGGVVGKEITYGYFDYFYEVMFPFVIDDRQFFYGQNRNKKNYFFQELYGDGRLGYETTSGHWLKFYDIQFPFQINEQHYFYGQSKADKYFFIQEIKHDGTPGVETDQGFLDSFGTTQFPFIYENRQYIYIEDGASWYTAEITANGKLRPRERVGDLIDHHDFAYTIDGDLYFYGQNENNDWVIDKIVLCDKTAQLDRRHYSDFRLASWNMQGAFNDGESKWVVYVSQQIRTNYDIMALQESGAFPLGSTEENQNPVDANRNDIPVAQRVWHLRTNSRPIDVFVYHVTNGAGNNRVSMAIISRRPAHEVLIIGPIDGARRPVLGIRLGNDYFFDIHAGAHGNNEALAAIVEIERQMSVILLDNPMATWVTMGDFNRNGRQIVTLLRNVTPPANVERGFSIPPRDTQTSPNGSSRILDFAVTGAGLNRNVQLIAQSSDRIPSDHNLVPFLGAFLFTNAQIRDIRRCG